MSTVIRTMPRSAGYHAARATSAMALMVAIVACQPAHLQPAPSPPEPPTRPHAAALATSQASARDGGAAKVLTDAGADPMQEASHDASTDAPPPEPALRGLDGGVLPQTHDRPSSDSPLFKYHAELLWRAIVKDDPSIAMPFFFPVLAYQQVKDIAKPERDWKYRLVAAFKRTIHDYHRRLGRDRDRCQLIGIEVPEKRARWMKPGSEGNKLSYWRVLDSILRYRDARGRRRELGITSFISWRGQWYVVHLHGFK